MATITVTSPNGNTSFTIADSWVTRLLAYAEAVDPTFTAQEKEAWVRRQMFVTMRKELLDFERNRDGNIARGAVDAMPVVEV